MSDAGNCSVAIKPAIWHYLESYGEDLRLFHAIANDEFDGGDELFLAQRPLLSESHRLESLRSMHRP